MSLPRLAVMGAPPAFAEPLHVGRPNLGDTSRFLKRTAELLERRWLTNNGPLVVELEARLSEFLGVEHVVAMCNGTVALEIAIRALGLTGEVIVPSFTFVGTAHALQWQEITPVFCDVDPSTHNIDPRRVEQLLTPRTTGIIGVHLWGRACDVQQLQAIADRHRLAVLYDAAHAFASEHDGIPVGGFGRAEVFSFHATKFFNSFEGGCVATNDAQLAEKMRLMRNFGFADYDTVIHVGTNGKMTEVAAAMGLTTLDSVGDFIHVNRAHHERYGQVLAELPGVRLLDPLLSGANNYQYVVLEIEESDFGLTRDELATVLWADNVLVRKYFKPGVHRMEPYRSFYPNAGLLLPVTERLAETVLVLPTGTAVSDSDVDTVGQLIRLAHEHRGAIRKLNSTAD